jgi:hypothetical protein
MTEAQAEWQDAWMQVCTCGVRQAGALACQAVGNVVSSPLCQVVVRNLQGKGTPLASCLQLPALFDHLCLQLSNPAGQVQVAGIREGVQGLGSG